jgi:hypothetical protein
MSDKIDFLLLNNHNYHEWKNHAMSLLQSKQLYRLVIGVKLCPTSPGTGSYTTISRSIRVIQCAFGIFSCASILLLLLEWGLMPIIICLG